MNRWCRENTRVSRFCIEKTSDSHKDKISYISFFLWYNAIKRKENFSVFCHRLKMGKWLKVVFIFLLLIDIYTLYMTDVHLLRKVYELSLDPYIGISLSFFINERHYCKNINHHRQSIRREAKVKCIFKYLNKLF